MEEPFAHFDWVVERLSSLEPVHVSPTFESRNRIFSWCLELHRNPNLHSTESKYYLQLRRNLSIIFELCYLFLPVVSENWNKVCHLQVRLLDREGRPWKLVEMKNFHLIQLHNGLPLLFPDDLRSPKGREVVLDDMLRIQVSIWITGEQVTSEISVTTGEEVTSETSVTTGEVVTSESSVATGEEVTSKTSVARKDMEGILEDIGGLMNDSSFSDVTITTTGSKSFKAHKAILAARSPVFAAMFKSPMAEAESGCVEIQDFEASIVEAMLSHIYTGDVNDLGDMNGALLQIADKYDLPRLREGVETTMANSLSVETAADVLLLAHLHKAAFLKDTAMAFINRHRELVTKTEAFQRLLETKHGAGLFTELYQLALLSQQQHQQ